MKRVNKFECPVAELSASRSFSFRNIFFVAQESFIEIWLVLVIAMIFCTFCALHYGFSHIGYGIFSFISEYTTLLSNIVSGKEL